jgi:hypothetical protein
VVAGREESGRKVVASRAVQAFVAACAPRSRTVQSGSKRTLEVVSGWLNPDWPRGAGVEPVD